MLLEVTRPFREQRRGSRGERARVAKAVVYACGSQRHGFVRAIDTLDAAVAARFEGAALPPFVQRELDGYPSTADCSAAASSA